MEDEHASLDRWNQQIKDMSLESSDRLRGTRSPSDHTTEGGVNMQAMLAGSNDNITQIDEVPHFMETLH